MSSSATKWLLGVVFLAVSTLEGSLDGPPTASLRLGITDAVC
ncbi:MAG: hypothetical protein VX034_02035 [Planctomycetota bacterium]|nr:hypothetical protein [Planctomycetota bacterium]MEC8345331.1 hypothetical protein [Planctomycetota bacterium]